MGRLEGKVAMVTGSGGERGFGRAIARRLAADGADLVLTDIAPAGVRVVAAKRATGWRGLEAVADEVRAAGRRAVVAQVDVRAADQVRARHRPGRPDVRPDRHPRQQRRRPSRRRPRPRGRAAGRGVARDPGDEPHRHLSLQQGRRRAHGGARHAGPHHQHVLELRQGRLRAAGRVLRLQVRRDRVHPGPRHGAGAPPHHGERDLPGLGRHRSARLPRPAPRRELRRGAPGGRPSPSGPPRFRFSAWPRPRTWRSWPRFSPRTPPATSPGRRSTWRAAPSCTDGAGCRQVPPSTGGSPWSHPRRDRHERVPSTASRLRRDARPRRGALRRSGGGQHPDADAGRSRAHRRRPRLLGPNAGDPVGHCSGRRAAAGAPPRRRRWGWPRL